MDLEGIEKILEFTPNQGELEFWYGKQLIQAVPTLVSTIKTQEWIIETLKYEIDAAYQRGKDDACCSRLFA